MVVASFSLPPCPSTQTLAGLQPSQRSATLTKIVSVLLTILSLPDNKLSAVSVSEFIGSYARNCSYDVLSSLVYGEDEGKDSGLQAASQKRIRAYVLQLAGRVASLPNAGGLGLQTLFDLAVVYGPKNATRAKSLLKVAFESNHQLYVDLKTQAIPSFTRLLLRMESGLHAIRKTGTCVVSFLRCAPPDALDAFARNKNFMVALAQCYDIRLSSIATNYGGIDIDRPDRSEDGEARMLIGCKVDLLDAFHLIIQQLIAAVVESPTSNAEYTLDLFLTLLELPSSSSGGQGGADTPFLNRSLLQDHSQTYSLSSTLSSILANANDPRLRTLDNTLRSFESEERNAGALKLLLRSSGILPGIDYRSTQRSTPSKGKERASVHQESTAEDNEALDLATSSVLEIFPDHTPDYIRALLRLPAYNGDPEKVINALLTSEAPPQESVVAVQGVGDGVSTRPEVTPERRNVFDDEWIDPATVTMGKRREDEMLRGTAFTRQMKEDILRRMAEQSDSEDELEAELKDRIRQGGAFAEEDSDSGLDESVKVKVAGDGEESGSDEDEQGGVVKEKQTPETILELAYIRDPNLFNRDAATRRSKPRMELRTQTGWSDEQIEGWKIMLERNPKKEKILQKHEFAGNKPLQHTTIQPTPHASGSQQPRGGHGGQGHGHGGGNHDRGRGHGRGGRGSGRGGRGGNHAGESGDGGDRSWKGKNKARQANHDRKRGHDKKMAKGGAPMV